MPEQNEVGTVNVEVAYALPDKQKIVALSVPAGTTARQAAEHSNIVKDFPDLDLATADMGIFGKTVKADDYKLTAGDRVEIYRPLLIDPKAARKARAEKVSKKKAEN